jgi:nitroreductase
VDICEKKVSCLDSQQISYSRVRRLITRIFSQRGSDATIFYGGRAKSIASQNPLSLLRQFAYDAMRYMKWSQVSSLALSKEQLRSEITALYHTVEKGLSYSSPRPGFGIQNVNRLLLYVRMYRQRYGDDDVTLTVDGVLESYISFCQQNGGIPRWLSQQMLDVQLSSTSAHQGGAKVVSRRDIEKAARVNFKVFCEQRYSVRHFSSVAVDDYVVKAAVSIAQKTPSVCNRQCWRVHVFSGEEDKRQVLECQSGNRGFGHEASRVLVVTSDLQPFAGTHERYQSWIDGGMFAMSLVYALHSFGLGTCCLNWSVNAKMDKRLKQVAEIPSSENVIMMIAVGNLVEEFKVACSTRRTPDSILSWH